MKDIEAIKSKVRKLLALSKSNNEYEACAALAKANELMDEYGLDGDAVETESVGVKGTSRYVKWHVYLGNAVAWLYACFRYVEDGQFVFVGDPLRAFMAAEMYTYLRKTVERAAKTEIRKNAKRKFRNDFRTGMADRIYHRIMELGRECAWCSQDERDAAIETAKESVVKTATITFDNEPKKGKTNKAAFRRGAATGEGVSLARQTGYRPAALPEPQKREHTWTQGNLF